MLGQRSVAPLARGDSNFQATTSPVKFEMKKLSIHRICLFGFDENKGNTLLASSKISKKHTITSHTDAELAEICLPDGGHLREHDAASIIFRTSSDILLYGYVCFRNVKNACEKRGARQASLLIVSDSPGMDLFRPFLVDALDILINRSVWGDYEYWCKCLSQLRISLERGFNRTSSTRMIQLEDHDDIVSIDLWSRSYKIRRLAFLPGEFGGASLRDLLKVFREKTMRIWYAVAAEKRVVFVASQSNASSVSSIVLATPLLVGDLAPFVCETIEPYLTLAVIDRIVGKKTFVCGTGNGLFLQKSDWWDVCCDLSTGTVYEESHSGTTSATAKDENSGHHGKSKLSRLHRRMGSGPKLSVPQLGPLVGQPRVSGGTEMAFVSRVLHDMEFQTEAWLRRQFHDFTLSFLNRVGRRDTHADLTAALAGLFPGTGIMQSKLSKFGEQFVQTNLWKSYRARQDEVWGGSVNKTSPVRLAKVNTQESMPSPSSCPSMVEDENGFLYAKGKSLAPFLIETATGATKAPTGFVKVDEWSKRSSSNISKVFAVQRESSVKNVSPSSPSSEARWVRVNVEEGEAYYWNVATGETSWDSPDDALL